MSKLSRGKPPSAARPTRRAAPLKVADLAPHERDAVAFWFRRIITTLALANGTGILAMSSFISSSKDLRVAAMVTYPSLSFFLIGGVITIVSFVISLIWAGFRGDAYGEYFAKISEIIKSKPSAERSVYYTYMTMFTIVFFGQIGAIITSGAYFYFGAAEVVNGLGAVACAADKSLPYCEKNPSFLFARDEYSESGAALKHATALIAPAATAPPEGASASLIGFTVNQNISADKSKLSAKMNIPESIDVGLPKGREFEVRGTDVIVRVDVIREYEVPLECQLIVANFYIGKSSPVVLNPKSDRFLAFDRKRMGSNYVSISIQQIAVGVKYKADNGYPEYPDFVIEHGAVSQRDFMPEQEKRDKITTGLLSSNGKGGISVFNYKPRISEGCVGVAKELGWTVFD